MLQTYLYPNDHRIGHFSQLYSSLAFAGTVVGMLVFGVAVDLTGRKGAMLFASIWLAIFSILAAGAWGAGGAPHTGSKGLGGLFSALIAYRFLIGIGIGAEYPAGSVAASENTEDPGVNKNRQQMYFSLATNCAIDFGFVVAAFVPLVILWIVGGTSDGQLTTVWRVSLGLGAVPPLLVLLFRFQMKETEQYNKYHIKWNKLPWWLIIKRYGVRYTALCLAWWCYDWVSYPTSLYISQILLSVVKPDDDGKQNLYQLLGWTTLINVFYLPGTLIGSLVFVERLGPKNTMIFGLIVQAAFGFGLAGGYSFLQNHIAGYILVLGCFLAFGELGPGNNLGLLASKAVAPTCIRGIAYGGAAAVGKIGAFVGTYVYTDIQNAFLPNKTMYYAGPFYISGGLAIFSALITFFFIPPVVQDGMHKEDEAFIAYLEAHGYDTKELGLRPTEAVYEISSQDDTKKLDDEEAYTQTRPVTSSD